jgi:hypothetical protein
MTEKYDVSLKARIPIYEEIVAAGINETEAFLFSNLFASCRSTLYPITPTRYSAGHSVFSSEGTSEGYYRSFLNGKFRHPGSPLTSEGYTEGIQILWGKTSVGDAFFEWVKLVKPLSAKKAVDHHIFRRVPSSGWEITNRAELLSVLKQVKERIYA